MPMAYTEKPAIILTREKWSLRKLGIFLLSLDLSRGGFFRSFVGLFRLNYVIFFFYYLLIFVNRRPIRKTNRAFHDTSIDEFYKGLLYRWLLG